MNGRIAKGLKREAEKQTIGQPARATRKYYKRLKQVYKKNKGEI